MYEILTTKKIERRTILKPFYSNNEIENKEKNHYIIGWLLHKYNVYMNSTTIKRLISLLNSMRE